MLKYLLDEMMTPVWRRHLQSREPGLEVFCVGDPGVPPKRTLDPDIPVWCEDHDCVLVTYNRNTIPAHLADHLAMGRHVPGIFMLINPNFLEMVEELVLVAVAHLPGEYADHIRFLPLSYDYS